MATKNEYLKLTPYPEVAGPIIIPRGDFSDESVFFAILDCPGNENGGLEMIISIVQLDQIEVAIINGLDIGIVTNVVVSLLISILKKVEAGPLPGIRIIL